MTQLILASKSASRQALLAGAGLKFDACPTDTDERTIKDENLRQGKTPAEIALILAEAKALALPAEEGALVIGGDQVLEFDGKLYDKPTNMTEAADRLAEMAGKEHYLRNGLVLAQNGQIVWRHKATATLRMRDASRAEVEDYLAEVGDRVLATVGAYELEGPGVRLFDQIDGDYFTILGLPLLPLLGALRERDVLPW